MFALFHRRPGGLPLGADRQWSRYAAVLTALGLALGLVAPAATAAQPLNPRPVQVIGGPGHAGLYGWGAATMLDGTILIGDYWNYRILHFHADGTPVGDGVFVSNRGYAPDQHQSPYGIGVDPRNGDVYFADTDRDTIDVYDAQGTFLRTWGKPGTGVGKFQYPSRVVIDSQGTVYVADTWANTIVVSDDQGNEIRRLGTFGTAPGQLKQPHGLALDAQDNLYVVDTNNSRIQAFHPGATQPFLVFGSKGRLPGQFTGDLRGIAIDTTNEWVYVVDAAGNQVSKFDLQGNFLLRWGSEGYGPGQFHDGGRELTVDQDGNVWVGDMPSFRAQKFSPNGEYLLSVTGASAADPVGPVDGGFNGPRGVAVGPDGSVYVGDTYNWRLQRFSAEGDFLSAWGHRGRAPYEFNYTRMIATSPVDGAVIVTDTDNHRIKAYSPDGTFLWQVGELGAKLGQFKNPHGVDVGPDGVIYVADSRNQRIQVLSAQGEPLRTFGTNGTAPGQFKYPRGITVDPANGDLYVADSTRDIVQVFTNDGTYLRTIGSQGAADSQFKNPFDVAVDADYLFVADPAAHKIKVFDKATGAFVMAFGSRGTKSGKFLQPDGLQLLPDGRLYVSEEGTERISVWQMY